MANSAAPARRPTRMVSTFGWSKPSMMANTTVGSERRQRPVTVSTHAVTINSSLGCIAAHPLLAPLAVYCKARLAISSFSREGGFLLACAVVARGLPKLLDVRRRQLGPIDLQRQLFEFTGELEWNLVLLGDRRAGVGADVEVLVPLQYQRDRALHRLARHFLAVDLEHASAAATDAAHVVERKRAGTQAVVLEVELQDVLAGC